MNNFIEEEAFELGLEASLGEYRAGGGQRARSENCTTLLV